MLQTMLADTPLVKNLDNDEFMKILLDGKANLEQLFADLELTATTHSTEPASRSRSFTSRISETDNATNPARTGGSIIVQE